MLKSTNGGVNWIQQVAPGGFKNSMWFYNDSVGWAVGASGLVLYTTNSGQFVEVKKISSKLPDEFKLYQNYPNPFNPKTIIGYNLKKGGFVGLIVYDELGRVVNTLVNENQKIGSYEVSFSGGGLSSGIYFYSLFLNGELLDTKKMILLK